MRFNSLRKISAISATALIAITLATASFPSKINALSSSYPNVFIIKNAGGKCLDVRNCAIYTNGTPVQIYTCNNTPAQQWAIDSYAPPGSGGSIYTVFRNPVSNMCLDVRGGAINTNGTPLQIYSCNNTAAQTWSTFYSSRLVNELYIYGVSYGGKCLDVRDGHISTDQTPVQIYTCNGTSAQNWNIVEFTPPFILIP